MNAGLAVLAGVIVLYGALALRLGRWSISMPIIFVAVGYLLGSGGTGLLDISPTAESIRALAELTLAVLLFADAFTHAPSATGAYGCASAAAAAHGRPGVHDWTGLRGRAWPAASRGLRARRVTICSILALTVL